MQIYSLSAVVWLENKGDPGQERCAGAARGGGAGERKVLGGKTDRGISFE